MTGPTGPDVLDSGGGSWWRDEVPVPRRGGGPLPPGPDEPAGAAEPDELPPDEEERDRRAGRRRRLRLVAGGAAVALAGAAVGATLVDRRYAAQELAQARAAVDLRYDAEDLLSVWRRDSVTHWHATLWLRNAGDRPVEILDARVIGDGWDTDPLEGPATAPPDDRAAVRISGGLDCGAVQADGTPQPLALRVALSVRTEDGIRREVDLGDVPQRSVLRELPAECNRQAELAVRDLAATVDGDRVRGRVIIYVGGVSGPRIEDVRLVPPAAFTAVTTNVPQRLSEDATGQVGLDLQVMDCESALAFDPVTARLEVLLSDGTVSLMSAPVPPRLAAALVRLSERSCAR